MALNFGLNRFVDPNVQIAGNEIPLEAIKTSADKLQDVYLRAQDTDTKTEAAMKQMMLSTDPVARDAAKALYGDFQNRLQQRVQAGDYENMHQATQRDAMNLGVNMQALMNQKKEIDAVVNRTLEQKGIQDPIKRKELADMYRANLAKPTYNAETGLVDNFDVQNRGFADDFATNEFLNKLGSGWQSNSTQWGNQNYSLGKDGIMYKMGSKGRTEVVDAKEVRDALTSALKGEAGFNAEVNRDTELFLHQNPKADPDKARSYIEQQKMQKALNFAVPKYAYKQTVNESTKDFDAGFYSAFGGGSGTKPNPLWTQGNSPETAVNTTGIVPENSLTMKEGKIVAEPKWYEKAWDMFDYLSHQATTALAGGPASAQKMAVNEVLRQNKKDKETEVNKYIAQVNDPTTAEHKAQVNLAIARGYPADVQGVYNMWTNMAKTKANIGVQYPNTASPNPKVNEGAVNLVKQKNFDLFGDESGKEVDTKTLKAKGGAHFNDPDRGIYTLQGGKLTSNDFYAAVGDANVGYKGTVQDWKSPQDFGSDQITATNGSETNTFFVGPNQTTRQSPAFEANQIYKAFYNDRGKHTFKDPSNPKVTVTSELIRTDRDANGRPISVFRITRGDQSNIITELDLEKYANQ